MGRVDANPSSDQSPQGYPDNNNQNVNQPRSYVPENMPPPEAYPPQKPAPTYPPPQPEPVQYPPPPPQPEPVQFPPPQPQPQPQFQPGINAQTNYNYAQANAQQYGGYQTPVRTEGIAIGSQYLAPTQPWATNNSLFDCAEDPENALITACFPCITFGQIAEIVDNGQTSCATSGLIYCLIASFIAIPCIMSCTYRTKIRNRYGLIETPAPDWVTHCFCEWCALCQEYRELKSRGLDPAIGWQGNMMKNQQMQMQQYPAMTPPMNQTMM